MHLLENHTVCEDKVHSLQLLAYYHGMSSHVLTATVSAPVDPEAGLSFWNGPEAFHFYICYLWIPRERLQQPQLLPTWHTLLWELGFSWTQVSFPLSSSPDFSSPHTRYYLSSISVSYTQLVCYSSRHDFSPACLHHCQQHAEGHCRPFQLW